METEIFFTFFAEDHLQMYENQLILAKRKAHGKISKLSVCVYFISKKFQFD